MPRFMARNLPQREFSDILYWFNAESGAGESREEVLKPDPRIVFDLGNRDVSINMSYADLMDRFPNLKQTLYMAGQVGGDHTPKEAFYLAFATEEEKQHAAKMLDDSREHYRGFAYQNTPNPNINPAQTQAQQTAHLLNDPNNPGMILGGGHGDKDTKDMLIASMNDGTISPNAGTGLVFIEELKEVFQPLIDEYLDGPPDAPLPKPLRMQFEKLRGSMPHQDFAGILQTAKAKKVRVYGMDTGDASPECKSNSPLHPEQRCAMMNAEAERIIKKAKEKHPGQKFIALTGSAHSNTHAGGIPGLSQILKAPAVLIDPANGKLQWHQEDPTNRKMPSKGRQMFLDRYFSEVEKGLDRALKAAGHVGPADVTINKTELRTRAMGKAKGMSKGIFDDTANVAKVAATDAFADWVNAEVQLIMSRRQQRQDLTLSIENGADWETQALLPGFVADDPEFFTTEAEATGTTLLHKAAALGKADHMAVLINNGADANAVANGLAPLHEATSAAVVQALIGAGAVPNPLDKDGRTPARRAADGGHAGALTQMLAQGGDANRPGYDGVTPLHAALSGGHGDAARALLTGGANPNTPDPDGLTPLQAASRKGRADVIPDLVNAGAPINQVDADGNTPLLLALASGQGDTARALLARNADANQANNKGDRPVHLAAEKGQIDLVRNLVAGGANLALTDAQGRTGLQAAMVGAFKQRARQEAQAPQQNVKDAKARLDKADNDLKEAQRRLQELHARHEEINQQIVARSRKGEGPGDLTAQSLKVWQEVQDAVQAVQVAQQARLQPDADYQFAASVEPQAVRRAAAEADCNNTKQGAEAAERSAKDLEPPLKEKEELLKRAEQRRAEQPPSAVKEALYHDAVAARDLAQTNLNNARQTATAQKDLLSEKEQVVRELSRPYALDEAEIDRIGAELAQAATLNNTLTSLDDIDGLVSSGPTDARITEVINRTVQRPTTKRHLVNALNAKQVDQLDGLITKDPYLLNIDLDPDGNPGSIPLHMAAKAGAVDVMMELVRVGADVNVTNSFGANALHVACKQRVELTNQAGQAKQLGVVRRLVALHVPLNAQDSNGQTPLHQASRNPNASVVRTLLQAGADETIQDKRGWRAVDVAVATTKPKTEEAYYAHSGDANVRQRIIGDDETGLDTITVLMRATKCENPQDVVKIEEAYRELYANRMFRPILDMAALDASLARKAPELDLVGGKKGGGLRIFVADDPQVGHLYNAAQLHKAPQGAFDEKADVLQLGARQGEESHYFPGTLIHELTHMAARVMYGQDTIPCRPGANGHLDDNGKMRDDVKDDPYVQAIQADMRQISLCEPSNAAEAHVLKTIAGRMSDSSYLNRGDLAFLQEFLVGVPQLIAEFGVEMVQKFAPNLTRHFTQTFVNDCQTTIENDPRYAEIYDDQFDNRQLIQDSDALPLKGPPPDAWVRNGKGLTAQGLADRVRKLYVTQHGQVKVPPERDNASLPYSVECFELGQAEKEALDGHMAAIEEAFATVLQEGALPAEVSADVLRGLVKDVAAEVHGGNPRHLGRAVLGRVRQFQREASKTYLEREVAAGQPLDEGQVAELVLLRAEDDAWQKAHPLAGGVPRPEFNAKKHRALVRTMRQKIAETFPADTLAKDLVGQPVALDAFVQEQVDALTEANRAVYTRANNPDKVKLDKARVEQVWFERLRQLSAT